MNFKSILILAVVALLTACGGKLDGAYSAEHMGKVLVFKSNGKARYMGAVEVDYEVDGNEIKLHGPDNKVVVLKVQEDGSILFPFLGKLTKVAS